GRPHAWPGAYGAQPQGGPADDLAAPGKRPPLPAQLPARNLAGLALLGRRAGRVARASNVAAPVLQSPFPASGKIGPADSAPGTVESCRGHDGPRQWGWVARSALHSL